MQTKLLSRHVPAAVGSRPLAQTGRFRARVLLRAGLLWLGGMLLISAPARLVVAGPSPSLGAEIRPLPDSYDRRMRKYAPDFIWDWVGYDSYRNWYDPDSPRSPDRPRSLAGLGEMPVSLEITSATGALPLTRHTGLETLTQFESQPLRAASHRFLALLSSDISQSYRSRSGQSVFRVRRHADGRLSEVEVVEDGLGPLFNAMAERALLESQPWPEWPQPVKDAVGEDACELKVKLVLKPY